VRYGGLVDADVIFIAELDDIKEEHHGLLRLDHGDRSGLYPLCELVYGDKQVDIAPMRPFEGSD